MSVHRPHARAACVDLRGRGYALPVDLEREGHLPLPLTLALWCAKDRRSVSRVLESGRIETPARRSEDNSNSAAD